MTGTSEDYVFISHWGGFPVPAKEPEIINPGRAFDRLAYETYHDPYAPKTLTQYLDQRV